MLAATVTCQTGRQHNQRAVCAAEGAQQQGQPAAPVVLFGGSGLESTSAATANTRDEEFDYAFDNGARQVCCLCCIDSVLKWPSIPSVPCWKTYCQQDTTVQYAVHRTACTCSAAAHIHQLHTTVACQWSVPSKWWRHSCSAACHLLLVLCMGCITILSVLAAPGSSMALHSHCSFMVITIILIITGSCYHIPGNCRRVPHISVCSSLSQPPCI